MPGRTLALPLSHAIKSLRRTTNAVPPPAKTEHKYTSVKNHMSDEFQNALLKLKSVRNTRLLWTNIYVIFTSHLWIAMLYE